MEHVDVIVIGAGISGLSAGYHLSHLCPDRSFVILEGRADLGGTWDLFRYPGVRSDSDMHTLGFSFKPWVHDQAIADGPAIMEYLRETVDEFGLAPHIRFRHRVTAASWTSDDARWTLTVQRGDEPEPVTMTCGFIMMCAGYYSYRHGHDPYFEGRDRFQGRIVHPQAWPDDLDWTDKRVVVIGSGATAMTIVPAMAHTAAHVAMVQRSPTYVVARPDVDRVANALRRVLPARWAYAITRTKNTALQQLVYQRSRTQPDRLRRRLLDGVRAAVGPEVDVERHFTPTYNPWDQRLCLLPHGDLFTALREGRASVITDHIDAFTDTGLRLGSGVELPADIIVTATGLEVVTMGEVALTVDGASVDVSTTWTYKGLAYSDVPNLFSVFGYINASWTLRADLINEYACRVLNHLWATGTHQVTPRLRPSDADMEPRPWITEFSAGYLQRVMGDLPRQGDREPWVNPQRLAADRRLIARGPIDDGVLQFRRAPVASSSPV
jgi:monooxygenase